MRLTTGTGASWHYHIDVGIQPLIAPRKVEAAAPCPPDQFRLPTCSRSQDIRTQQRVLVVDDDPGIRELLVVFLEDLGYAVVTANNGVEAIAQAQRSHPAAILMDLMMPVMSGADATIAIKTNPATMAIPVVAMSAGRNLAAMANGIPADGFVSKPFDLDVLTHALARHVSGKHS